MESSEYNDLTPATRSRVRALSIGISPLPKPQGYDEVLQHLQAAKLEQVRNAQLARATRLGQDTYDNTTVMRFAKQFKSDGEFNFAAIKAGGLWYLSGPAYGGQPMTWDELAALLVSGYAVARIEVFAADLSHLRDPGYIVIDLDRS